METAYTDDEIQQDINEIGYYEEAMKKCPKEYRCPNWDEEKLMEDMK